MKQFIFAFTATLIAIATSANAQMVNTGQVISLSGTQAPGFAPGVVFSSSFAQSVSIDSNNRLYVMGDVTGTSSTTNDRGWFSGTSAANFGLEYKEEDAVPGIAGTIIQRQSSTGTLFNGLPATNLQVAGTFNWVGIGINGAGVDNTTASATNTAILVGSNSTGYTSVIRQGTAAAGTAGAFYNTAFSGASTQTTAMNSLGTLAAKIALRGGDVSGTTNDQAIYRIDSGGPSLVVREAQSLSGGLTLASIDFNTRINDLNQIAFDGTLSGAGVTTANDKALFINNTIVFREGDAAPGTAGASYGSPNIGANAFSNAGFVASTTLTGGDVTGSTNDQAIYRANLTSGSLLVREGQVAGATGGNFGVFNNSAIRMNNNGTVLLHNTLTGGSVTTADDTSYWMFDNLNVGTLIAREGALAPGLAGLTFANMTATTHAFNDLNQSIMALSLAGAGVTSANDNSWWAYDPMSGLQLVAREGDSFEVAPGDVRTISGLIIKSGFSSVGSEGLNNNGFAGFYLNFSDGTRAVLSMELTAVPEPVALVCVPAILMLLSSRRNRRQTV